MFINILKEIFYLFNNNSIDYIILRDFNSYEAINNADDLDLSISLNSKDKAIVLLKKAGWASPKLNTNLYPHQQFYKWNGSKMYKLDICWSLSFENGKFDLPDPNSIYRDHMYLDEAKIPNCQIGLLVLLCHIIFDKGTLSERHLYLLKEALTRGKINDFILYKAASLLVGNTESLVNVKADLIKLGYVVNSKKRFLNFNLKLRQFLSRFVFKKQIKVCFVGVDGAGKSSTIGMVENYFGDKCYTQYLGARLYETHLAKKFIETPPALPKTVLIPIQIMAGYIDGFYRFNKAVHTKKEIIIYDRYVSESYINAIKQPIKLINYILFGVLFPKPDCYIYLYCPVEVSLDRKDDIFDIPSFIEKKKKTDTFYMKRKDSLCFDTAQEGVSQDDIKGQIIQFIFEKRFCS